jgi:hypothetical protein
MEMIDNIIQTAVGWFAIIPVQVWSILLGLVLSLLLTQFVKRVFPIAEWCNARKSERVYRLVLRSIAFFSASIATFATWPAGSAFRIYVAIAVGLATPIFYQVGTAIAYRVWANLEARLSGDP